MLLIRQAAVYAPEYLGVRDVLVCAGLIVSRPAAHAI